jgi:hypothetical protein
MEEYINEEGDLYTIEEINQTAKENNTTFDDIIKRNKLALKPKKQEKVQEVKVEVPGKRKSVAMEDAGATVKSTVSKSVKPSSALKSDIWGKDRSKPEFLQEIQKASQPKVKFTKPVDIVKPKQDLKLISEYQDNLKKEEESTFSNFLKESFDSGVSTIVKSFYKAPEYIYNAAAVFTNPVADLIGNITGAETKDASSERIMETFGIKNVPADILQERISKSNKIIQDYSTKNGVDPLTAIQNGNYLGAAKLTAGSTVQSFPMMMAAMLSGGSSTALAGISASTAISKADQLQRENPEMDVQTRTVNSAVSGLLEGYLGQLFTGASGAVVKKILVDKGSKAGSKIISNGLMSTLETAIEKNPMIGVIGEIAEEGSVELGNQLNDMNSGLRKELDYRAITNAGIIATGMAGTNTIPVYGAKGYMKAAEYNQVKAVNKEINTLTNQLSNPYINDSDKKIISSRVNRLVDENKTIVGTSLEKIKALPENIKTEINTINTDLDDIKSKYLDLTDNDAIPLDVKAAMGEELKLQGKQLYDRKNSIIEGNYIYEDFNKLPAEEQIRIKEIANQTLIADSELTGAPKVKFNEEEINREAVTIYNNELKAKDFVSDVEKTKVAIQAIGLGEEVEMPELNSANDVIDYLSTNTTLDKNTIDDIADSYGAFIPLPNGKEALIINKEAANMDQVVTTGQHEFLHKLIYKAVTSNKDLQKQIGTQLYNHIESYIGTEAFNNTEFKSRYDAYKNDFETTKLDLGAKVSKAKDFFNKGLITQERYDQAMAESDVAIAKAEGKYLEETLPLLSESLSKGDIKYNETFFTKIGDILRRVFQKYGLSKVKFNTGEDIFNFVRDYNKSFEKGQFTKAFRALAKEGAYKGSMAKGVVPVKVVTTKAEVKLSKVQVDKLKQDLIDLEEEYDEGYGDIDEEEYKNRKANIEGKLKTAIKLEEKGVPVKEVKKEITEEDEVKEIIKKERGSISSDRVQQIYDSKGINGAAAIIKLFEPITKKIVDKRRDAPGFDRELLTDEINTGVGGILDLITKYKPESGIPLAAYINKYLPVRAIATSKRILDQQFNKDASEEKGLMATETADQNFIETTKEKPKYKNALESKVFELEVLKTINDKILTVVRTLKSKIDEPISLNKTITPLIAEIRDEIGKQVDIDVKTAMGGKKDNQLKNWMLKNKKYVLENMTTTWLMGKDGQGGMPIAVQKQIDGRWVNFPEWVGKKIDREKTTTDQAGRTSGAELTRRLPSVNSNISDAEYLDQVIGPDGNPLRGRKESLAKAIAEESTFDIISDDLQNDGPISEALIKNQERLGVQLTNNVTNEFAKQAERGNVKFSKSLIKGIAISQDKLGKDIFNAKTIEDEAKVINKWIASDGRSLRTFAALVKKSLSKFITNKGLFENIILPTIKTYSKFEGLVGKDSYRLGEVSRGVSIFFGEEKVPLWKDVDEIKNNWERSAPIMEKESINAGDQLFDIIGYFKNNNYSNEDFEAYLQFLRKDQRGLIRKLSKPGIAVLGLNKKQNPYLEHNMPVQNIVEKILDFYNNKITENELKEFIDKGSVNLVPNELNKILPNYKVDENRMEDPNVLLYLQDLLNKGYSIYNIEGEYGSKANFDALVKVAQSKVNSKENLQNIYNTIAVENSLDVKKSMKPKGISVFDFDDTVGMTSGSVLYTMPDGSTGKLNAEEFAKEGSSILEAGGIFDFSEFSKVVDGKPGPMVEKMKKMIAKFGNENFFILTARPANAAGPIKEFLDSIGIDIPLENITGLGNSAAQAKADWITAKAAEGYNDFYFADDAIQNVEAVKNALDVLDVKSKIQQAKIKFSKTISSEFNKIISKNTGIGPAIEYSDIVAKRKGAGKNLFDLYVPASAADFELLLYNFLGKGKEGETQMKFFSDALLKPYANGNDLMDAARQSIKNNYKELIKAFPGIAKKLEKLTPDGNFTYDQALRVAMWNGSDVEIPGLSKTDTRVLTSLVNNDAELSAFAEGLIVLGRQGNGWVKPGENWDASTIISDLHNLTEGDGRKQFLAEFIDNAEQMFGKFENGKLVGPNMNKIEAIYGTDVRESIEDVLYRMTSGKNRSQGKDKITNKWLDWVSGSTGTIMFLNTRSAALQLIGAVNFLNLRDNNPIAAGAAFANQSQYWEDFAKIWNSSKMKERRGGLKEDVAAAEIANAAATSKNKPTAVVSYLLKIGYTPTQLADSFAIASGGAPFYRNRVKSYLKEGLTEQEAEEAAWGDFTKVSDETQQSGDPRDISKQQASGAGRLLLTFQNTAMQQSRIVKKSFLDLKNGRGNAKTHIAKIAYYLAIQNLMFSTLQQGLFAVLFHEEDEDDEAKKKRLKEKDKKAIEIASGVVDTVVRGTGLLGGVLVTLKNVIKKYMEEEPKGYKADYTKVVLEATNISPPIGSKVRKIYSGLQQTKFDKDLIKERGWGVMQDGRVHLGPMYSIVGKGVEATVNFPMERLVNKVENTSQMFNSQNQAWQRVMLGLGWNPRSVGIEEAEGDIAIEAKAKEVRKEEGKIKGAETRARTKDSIRALPMAERIKLKREAALKRREEKIKKRNKRKMG